MHIHKIHHTGHKTNVSGNCHKNHKISQTIGEMVKKKAGLQFFASILTLCLTSFLNIKLEGLVWEKQLLLFCTSPCMEKKLSFQTVVKSFPYAFKGSICMSSKNENLSPVMFKEIL